MVRGFPVPIIGQNAASGAQVIDGSLKFVKETDHYLTRAMTDGNHGKFTISCWLKPTDQEDYLYLMGVSSECSVYITNTRKLHADFYAPDGSSWAVLCDTDSVLRDPTAFYHLVITLDSSSGNNSDGFRVYVNGEQQPITFQTFWGGSITGDVKHVNKSGQTFQINSRPGQTYYNSFYLSQYNYIDGQALGPGYFGFTDPLTGTWRPKKLSQGDTSPVNDGTVWSSGTKTTTGSGLYSGTWDKVFDGILDIGVANGAVYVYNNSSATLTFPKPLTGYISVYGSNGSNSATDSAGTDQIVLSDGSTWDVSGLNVPAGKWYNFGYKENITSIRAEHNAGSGQGTFLRKIAVNGVELLDNDTSSVDFGTNGFYLPMDNADDFEIDRSGKGNNYTKTNWAGTSTNPDVVKDSPSGAAFGGPGSSGITTTSSGPSNYCTLNPNDAFVSTKDGNLETVNSSGWQGIRATLGMKSGKFYWETQNNQTASAILGIADTAATGFVDGSIFGSTGHGGGDTNPAWTWAGANYYFNATTGAAGSLVNHTSSDIVQYAFDADNGKLWFGRNGTWYNSSWAATGDPANGVNPTVSGIDNTKTYVACASFIGGSAKFNFGQKPFGYAPPQGFLPINSANTTLINVIPLPDKFVKATTYGGNGGTQQIDFGFQPDLIFGKPRNASTGGGWNWVDSVRGNKYLQSQNTNAESDFTGGNGVTFNAKGVSLVDTANGDWNLNGNNGGTYVGSNGYVYYGFKSGGNKGTFNVDDVGYASAAAAGLTAGTITPTGASVGTKQGFSIVSYSGTGSNGTWPHGLLETPEFVIVKCRNVAQNFAVQHSGYGPTKYTYLNQAIEARTTGASAFWNDTAPTSTTVSVGTDNDTNASASGRTYIAYCWHSVPGLQKFGSYTGLNSTDGRYLDLGFRPAIIMFKNISSGSTEWTILDNRRDGYNGGNNILFPSTTDVENATQYGDFLSNGWKFRINSSYVNSTDTFIYAAWAETPASNLYGGQSNAR